MDRITGRATIPVMYHHATSISINHMLTRHRFTHSLFIRNRGSSGINAIAPCSITRRLI